MMQTKLNDDPYHSGWARTWKRAMAIAMIVGGASVGGCVNIHAPEKPIEIDLNINVSQQVVYRLDDSAKQLIKQNPGIF